MIYSLLADVILILHFSYILFVIFGGLLILRWNWIWKIHIPAVVWGFLVQYFVWICPLTTWENYFREMSGDVGYENGFIDYFLTSIIYLDLSPQTHTIFAVLLILINFGIYFYIFYQRQNKPL